MSNDYFRKKDSGKYVNVESFDGPYGGDNWLGREDRIVFENRPDPLSISREERAKALREQIGMDIK